MEGKICLVTGATAGIGLVTARELARQGARVIGVGRSPERCAEAVRQIREQTATTAVEYLVADLSSQAEIRRLAEQVRAATSRLDVLVNNAGLIRLKRELTVDGLEMTFALNHLAYFLFTNLLLDTIKARRRPGSSAWPRRLTSTASSTLTTCKERRSTAPGVPTSGRSLPIFSSRRELARRLDGTGVTANALHPGYVRHPDLPGRGFPGLVASAGR